MAVIETLTRMYELLFLHVARAAEATVNVNIPGSELIEAKGPVGLVEAAYNLAFMLAGGLAFGVIVYAGFLYATSAGNSSKRTEAKDRIESAFYGILLLLGSYILLNTVNPALTTPTFPTLARFEKAKSGEGLFTPEELNAAWKGEADEASGKTWTGKGPNASNITDAQARSQLNQNIQIKPNPEGASLDGLQQGTINELINLQKQCNCTYVVTSGTDGTHAIGQYSHANGYKFDLRKETNSTLYNYITQSGNFINTGKRSDGAPKWVSKSNPNVTYAEEGDHWDVVVNP